MSLSASSGGMTYLNTIRTAQNAACLATDYAYMVNTDDLTLLGDATHYDVPSVTTMGERMFTAITTQSGIEA